MFRKAAAALSALLLSLALVAASPGTADAASCSIRGASVSSWSCGRAQATSSTRGWVALQDLKTDGMCVRAYAYGSGRGQYLGQNCSSSPKTIYFSTAFRYDVVRLRLSNGRYMTVLWDNRFH